MPYGRGPGLAGSPHPGAIAGEWTATHQELGDYLGLSATSCARRVRMLEDAGFLTGFAALLDEARTGFGFSVFVSVKLDRQLDDQHAAFEGG